MADKKSVTDAEIEELVEALTIEEKASLLSGKDFWHSVDVPRLNIPSISMSDGPHGMRKQKDAGDQLGLIQGYPATCFPTASAIANSWNTDLGQEIGQALADEAVALGVNMILGPGLNIKRSPLCGRNFEYFSEDPYLAGKMAASYVNGIQSRGISACPKHFAANNQELLRMTSDSIVDERTFREIYLTGFEIAVKESKPFSIMSSYNRINGAYANENYHTLTEILRNDWGFNGIVISDWGGSNDIAKGVAAGSNLEMPGTRGNTKAEVLEALANGTLTVAAVDARLKELLAVVFALEPYSPEAKSFDEKKHHEIAKKAAAQSLVLLKNDNAENSGTPILPLKKGTSVALIGDFAETPRYQGAGSSMVNSIKLDTTLELIKENDTLEFIGYEKGFDRVGRVGGKNDALKSQACALAKKADVVLLYMGLDEGAESEGLDREHMNLRQNQIDLLHALFAVNKNIVVVLSAGSAVEMNWIDSCKALLHASLSGQAGAGAVLDALTGKVNPCGKLSETYPFLYSDTLSSLYFPGTEKTSEYRESIFVGYRYFDSADVPVRFPFGFGLSYTTFEYSHLKVSKTEVSFTLKNTGSVDGDEIVQLYIGKTDGSAIFRAKKELKGFARVSLKKGESKTVTIPLDDKAFRYFDISTNRFEVEDGEYGIFVGASVADIRLNEKIDVSGIKTKAIYNGLFQDAPLGESLRNVDDAAFERLLGRALPPKTWNRNIPFEENDTLSQLFYSRSLLARMAHNFLVRRRTNSVKSGKPDLNAFYIHNMPFRGIAKMSGGGVNMKMVQNILHIVNGKFFKGLFRIIAGGIKNFKAKHEAVFEFIMFNLLSNIATITNFVVLNIASAIFRNGGLGEKPFIFYIGNFPFFNYPVESGGFAMFLAFLLSYGAAQAVNFVVQRKLVFNSNNSLGAALPIYIVALLFVYVICVFMPTIISPFLISNLHFSHAVAMNVSNVVNIFIQVIILFPVLKFVVMKKVETKSE